jgi:hypothetical protein
MQTKWLNIAGDHWERIVVIDSSRPPMFERGSGFRLTTDNGGTLSVETRRGSLVMWVADERDYSPQCAMEAADEALMKLFESIGCCVQGE